MSHFKKILKAILYIYCALVLVLGFGFILGIGLMLYNILDTSIDAGENVARVEWLPDSASRICWFRSNLSYAVEFDIAEKDFLDWAGSAAAKKKFGLGDVRPIAPSSQPPFGYLVPLYTTVPRYTRYLTRERREEKKLAPEPPEELKRIAVSTRDGKNSVDSRGQPTPDHQDDLQTSVASERGWMYERSFGNGGGIWLAYDAGAARVFYYSSPR